MPMMTIQGLRKWRWPGHSRDAVTLPPVQVWWPADVWSGSQEPVWVAEKALSSADASLGGQLPLQGQHRADQELFSSAAAAVRQCVSGGAALTSFLAVQCQGTAGYTLYLFGRKEIE